MGQLLDDCLIAVDLLAHGVDLREQLRCEDAQLVGDSWSRLGEEVMPPILPEQAFRDDRPIG
jgi:hypothetical protein